MFCFSFFPFLTGSLTEEQNLFSFQAGEVIQNPQSRSSPTPQEQPVASELITEIGLHRASHRPSMHTLYGGIPLTAETDAYWRDAQSMVDFNSDQRTLQLASGLSVSTGSMAQPSNASVDLQISSERSSLDLSAEPTARPRRRTIAFLDSTLLESGENGEEGEVGRNS